jgi:endonuclease YncB( thermonuclease family)
VSGLEHRDDGWYLMEPERFPLVAVARVIDGDTLDIRIDRANTLRVRLFGVDTAEQGEYCYSQATMRLAALAGREVRLAADARTEDDFGRALRYVFTAAGRSLDAALIDEGLGRAWRDDGVLRDMLASIEDAASATHRGCIWMAAP